MNQTLIDTSGWAALFIHSERQHEQAIGVFQELRQQEQQFVTTNYILLELVALFTSPLRIPRHSQFSYIDNIRGASYVELVHVDAALDAAAWSLLKARGDKEWSLVDAVSFVVMQERGITQALTTDHHFEQAGFTQLLKT